MIPVRVPVDAPTWLVGGERTLTPSHPLYGTRCPVCDGFLLNEPITLVYVGVEPEDRKDAGWTTGAAVTVHAACAAPGARSESTPWVHRYVSTACEHAIHDNRPELHDECRLSCKYAPDGVESCGCRCHRSSGAPIASPPSWVEQARGGFLRLLAHLPAAGVDLAAVDPHLARAIAEDPAWFWARGEVQPDGVWTPPTTDDDVTG